MGCTLRLNKEECIAVFGALKDRANSFMSIEARREGPNWEQCGRTATVINQILFKCWGFKWNTEPGDHEDAG